MNSLSRHLKPYTWLIVITVLLVSFQAYINLYLPDLMSEIVNNGIAKSDTAYIVNTGWKMLGVTLLGVAAAIMASLFSSRAAMGFGRDLRNSIFAKVESFSLQEMDELSTASLMTRTTNDVTQIQNTMVMVLRMVVMAPVMGIGGVIMAFRKSASMSSILLIVVPVLIIGLLIIVSITGRLFKQLQKKIDKLTLVLRETVSGIRVIRAFNKEQYEAERFTAANDDLTKTALAVNRINALIFPLMMLIMNATTIAVLWFGTHQIDRNTLLVGDLMAVLQYVMQILFSFIMISMIFVFLPRASVAGQRINEVLKKKNSIVDSLEHIGADTKVKNESGSGGQKQPLDFKELTFEQVSFHYHNAPEPALKDIDFTLRSGKTTAIIGTTGAGKTSVLNLILRLYDPSAGKIILDGKDIKTIPLAQLRCAISYATQKPVIMSGTIRENIDFGRNLPDARIEQAADIAQVLEFAMSMEQGLDTPITQGGTNLSGGQKQRISLARALAGESALYIFDDTFSALDFKTDAKIRQRLHEITGGAAVLIVAQRVATVMHADEIILLKDGIIQGMGTHTELMRSCQVYSELVYSQLSKEEATA